MFLQRTMYDFTGGALICFNSSHSLSVDEFNDQKLSDIVSNSDIVCGSDYSSVMYILVPKNDSATILRGLMEQIDTNKFISAFYTDLFFADIDINNKDYNVIITNWDDDYLGDLAGIEKYETIRSGGMVDDCDLLHQISVFLSKNKYSKGMKEFKSATDEQEYTSLIFETIKECKDDDLSLDCVYMDNVKNIETLYYVINAAIILHSAACRENPNDQSENSAHCQMIAMEEVLLRALTIKSLSESSEKINICQMHYQLGKSDKKYSLTYDDKDYIDVRYGRNLENGSDVSVSSLEEGYSHMRKTVIDKYKGGYNITLMSFADNEPEVFKESESISQPDLLKMFQTSYGMGPRNQDQYRTYDYVKGKCMEELGELNVEIQIEQGQSYKEPGKDGIRGEAVDLAITAMDMFALSCNNMSPEEMQKLFLDTMSKKLDKWIKIVTSS